MQMVYNKMIEASILISSYERLPLFRRTLWSIAKRPPSVPFEVIVADDNSPSKDQIIAELHKYDFPSKFITVDTTEFTQKTGIFKFHNNPSLTNNVAFKHSQGKYIFLMGNECIAWENVFDHLICEHDLNFPCLVFSSTNDISPNILCSLDEYGSNLSYGMISYTSMFPLQNQNYHSDVTNYLSLTSRYVWEQLFGYDERYLAGIACEDSDFVRRARKIEGLITIRSQGLSLHQYHGGKTRYYDPVERGMNNQKWDIGLQINRKLYHSWDGSIKNQQPWEIGVLGVKDVVEKGYEKLFV